LEAVYLSNQNRKWRVAVVGCGNFAEWQYFDNIPKVADAECVAAVDIIPERARAAAAKHGIPNWYASVDELLAKCDFDIAIDAASIPAHHELNMALLTAGKHLISQKPAALNVADMNRQIAAAAAAGVKFACVPIHLMRPDIAMARQMIRDGAIGDVLSIKCVSCHGGPEYFQYRDADPTWFFEPGAGALYDMGVHALHQVTGIMGPAKRVACMGANALKQREVRSGLFDGKIIQTDKLPDNYFITLDFGNDKLGFVDTGFCQRATRSVPLEIFGEKGVISFDPPGTTWPNPKLYLDSPERGVRGWLEPQSWKDRRPANFNQCCCLKDLVDAIENDTHPVLSAEHARHVIEIMGAIPQAMAGGCCVNLETIF
jgi:UDP-N-acetyl-2-amino-2-deoxyglucuronate dehydrogenase